MKRLGNYKYRVCPVHGRFAIVPNGVTKCPKCDNNNSWRVTKKK